MRGRKVVRCVGVVFEQIWVTCVLNVVAIRIHADNEVREALVAVFVRPHTGLLDRWSWNHHCAKQSGKATLAWQIIPSEPLQPDVFRRPVNRRWDVIRAWLGPPH